MKNTNKGEKNRTPFLEDLFVLYRRPISLINNCPDLNTQNSHWVNSKQVSIYHFNMNLIFRLAKKHESPVALELLKSAAEWLQSNQVNQWQFWLDPPKEKIDWVEEGFVKNEFFFIESSGETIGMFRLLREDTLYWGKRTDNARYLHSFVIVKKFAGNNIGKNVLDKIAMDVRKEGVFILRLDCNAANDKLCKYYENQDFKKVGEKQMQHSLNNLYEKILM
jgi:hypothetical protein